MRLIDADSLIEKLNEKNSETISKAIVIRILEVFPTANAIPFDWILDNGHSETAIRLIRKWQSESERSSRSC